MFGYEFSINRFLKNKNKGEWGTRRKREREERMKVGRKIDQMLRA